MDIIKDINLDIDRCTKVLRENDYMEVVIAIEELQDKYRNKISCITENENHVVWNYSKKDLEKIEKYLIDYKKDMIEKEKTKNIYEKLEELKKYIEDNNIKEKENIEIIVDHIEKINNKDVSLDKKYEELKICFEILKNMDRKIGIYILELITLVIK